MPEEMAMAKSDTTIDAKVVARAWSDSAFKAQLLTDPNAALVAAGAAVPPSVTVKVVENTDKLVHLVLPARLADTELSLEAPEQVAAGTAAGCTATPSSCPSSSSTN
jgi:hypothetical protein